MPYKSIEYPMSGATYSHNEYGVYDYGEYEPWSVLAGQERRSLLGSFPTLEEARTAYPDAEYGGSGYREVYIPQAPPEWFDPLDAGEHWSEEDY